MFDWSNPKAYRASLITKPYEWLRDWWLRRPFAQLFDVAREFRRIEQYNGLVKKVFDMEFDADEIQSFRTATANLDEAFRSARTNV